MGATAAIITSMGLIAGLSQDGSNNKTIIAGLLVIAIADNISDSLSLHIYKESQGAKKGEITSATYGNFIIRFAIVLSFILIVFFLPTMLALVFSSIWGLILLVTLSLSIARVKKSYAYKEIFWHVSVAIAVVFSCKLLGALIYNHIL